MYYATKSVSAAVADVRGEEIEELGPSGSRFQVVTAEGESAEVRLALLGRHNVLNALAAIAVGLQAAIPLALCAAAIGELKPEDKRGEVMEWHGATIINDCYNSNPEALASMIRIAGGGAGEAAHPGGGGDAGAGPARGGAASRVRRSGGGGGH